jgi:hypothetical protein
MVAIRGEERRWAALSVLAFLTRPEGAVVAIVAFAIGVTRSGLRRTWLKAAAWVGAAAVVYGIFKLAYLGALIPPRTARPVTVDKGHLGPYLGDM